MAALAGRDGAQFGLRPFAVLTRDEPDARFESLGLDRPERVAAPSLFGRLAKQATALARGGPPSFAPVTPAPSAFETALEAAERALVAIAELGGLDVEPEHARRLAAAGAALDRLGFEGLGAALGRASRATGGAHGAALAAAHLVARARALGAALPWLARLR